MITVELNQKDLISLIRGTNPKYEEIDKFIKLGLGNYTGGFIDRWEWNYSYCSAWYNFSEEELYNIYLSLKG